ncbi:MAG: di-heme oxidoredictase family protein [Myxococcota bacterium]
MKRGLTPAVVGALVLTTALTSAVAITASTPNEEPPVAWAEHSVEDLAVATAEAAEVMDLERFEEFLEASEVGEAQEHVVVYQWYIDAGEHDLEELFARGDAFFEHEFELEDGLGATGSVTPPQRVHGGVRGGLDTFSCAGCHSLGGPDGAGSATQSALLFGDGSRASSAVIRNPPAVLGLGFIQALGDEMTRELQSIRDGVRARARASGMPQAASLSSKGVSFGTIRVDASGAIDPTDIEGVDADLVVKPFGWKGTIARLRRFAEDAARIHFGVQSHPLAIAHRGEPDPVRLGHGSDWWDPDGDGKQREVEEGTLTAASVYMAMLEVPVILPPASESLRERWARGQARFADVGCAECHRPTLQLDSPVWQEEADSPEGLPVSIHLLRDGETPRGTQEVALYSDLRRHDMGAGLRERKDDPAGVDAQVFLTRPLWGLAESAPYLHDGRALTIVEAILAHGGEAEASRDAFSALSHDAQADLHVFLLSLSRAPHLRYAR